jgi:chromosome segregation ATPase
MVSTSVALKSNLDVEVLRPSHSWPSGLFPTATSSPSKTSISLPPETESSSLLQPENNGYDQSQPIPFHVAQAISGLQREVLLLRNELNFELWLSRENVRHIGRLYQDRILSKNAEAERQGLYNKLRKYKAQVVGLERELKDHKEQASSAKNKYADWDTELQSKLREFREEKKSWITEAATLRSAEKEAQARFTAQGKLLAQATNDLFELQTQKKETQHKIDRLRDYERQIEQHVKMQRLWDNDFQKFNDRGEEIQLMKGQYRKMEMRLESYEKTQEQMDDQARVYRRQIQALEARLFLATKKGETSRHMPAEEIAAFVAEKSSLARANDKLREENLDLRDEVEEMRAMLEMLKAQVGGRRGLVSARASPIMFPGGSI